MMNMVRAAGFVGAAFLWSGAPVGAQCGVDMTCEASDTPAETRKSEKASFGQCGVNMNCPAEASASGGAAAPHFFLTQDQAGPAGPDFFGAPPRAERVASGSGVCGVNMDCTAADGPRSRPDGVERRSSWFTVPPGIGLCGVNMSCESGRTTDSTKPDVRPPRSAPTATRTPAADTSSDDPPVFGKTPWGAETLTGSIFKEVHNYITEPCDREPCSSWSQRAQQRRRQRALGRFRPLPTGRQGQRQPGVPASGQDRGERRRR